MPHLNFRKATPKWPKHQTLKRFLGTFILTQGLLFQSGCSLFFGNIKPIEEKSISYGIMDLSTQNSDWKRLEPSQDTNGNLATGIADASFQSQITGSIISINSACKRYEDNRKERLSALTRELLLGISEISYFKEESVPIDGNSALQTTVRGKMNTEDMMLRTVVVHLGQCIYDLMYVSRPNKFKQGQETFSRFVSSLKLK
jgi:hypothetical protein